MTDAQMLDLLVVLGRIATALEKQNESVAKIADGVAQAATAEPPIGATRG